MNEPATDEAELRQMAGLLRARNAIDDVIATITDRPVNPGHLGEWIAARIFPSNSSSRPLPGPSTAAFDRSCRGRGGEREVVRQARGCAGHDGAFVSRLLPRADRSALGRTHLTRYHPPTHDRVGLPFPAAKLAETIRDTGLKLGIATSVRNALWDAAEVYPEQCNPELPLSPQQRHLLALFSGAT